ncbi:hypothetical protein N9917_02420 [Deltaproteobacteria bacterium]|nr:hypothetical protein [Deltaproteobacteria bacterium]
MKAMTDKQWEAQDDARTLARAEKIKASPKKMKAAQAQAKKMVAEEKKELQGLQRVAGVGKTRKASPRRVTPKSRKLSY